MSMTIYTVTQAFKKVFKKALAWAPTKLPIGVEEFNAWAQDILATYDFPDNDSTRWALGAMIMHLGQTDACKPKRFFGLALHAAAAKQVAGGVFQDIKNKQLEAQKAAAEASKPQAEATAPTKAAASANVIPLQQ